MQGHHAKLHGGRMSNTVREARARDGIDLAPHFNYDGSIKYRIAIFSFNRQERFMAAHSHRFVEEFDGFVGYGLNRESDLDTVIYYLQKFSDDQLMELLRKRLTDGECQAIFDLLSGLLRKHLSEPEYHRYFLKYHH